MCCSPVWLRNAGLGDTNYETYQQMPRRLEERLLELSATCIYKRGEADDATGCVPSLVSSASTFTYD
jgi:sulfite reductase alpha subunit-like flavoprotein